MAAGGGKRAGQGRGNAAAVARNSGQSWLRLSLALLVGLPIASLLLPSLLLLVALLLPSLVALLIERREDRCLLLAVGLLNFCGALPALADLWSVGQGLSSAFQELRQPLNWLSAYGGAAVGWALLLLAPPLVAAWQAQRSASRLAELSRYRNRLEAAWGPEVAGEAPAKPGAGAHKP